MASSKGRVLTGLLESFDTAVGESFDTAVGESFDTAVGESCAQKLHAQKFEQSYVTGYYVTYCLRSPQLVRGTIESMGELNKLLNVSLPIDGLPDPFPRSKLVKGLAARDS